MGSDKKIKKVFHIKVKTKSREDAKEVALKAMMSTSDIYYVKIAAFTLLMLIGCFYLYIGLNSSTSLNFEIGPLKVNLQNTLSGIIVIIISAISIVMVKPKVEIIQE